MERRRQGVSGTVRLVKRMRERYLDLVAPISVVFHHVPKCGGTSYGYALRKRYLGSQTSIVPESTYKVSCLLRGNEGWNDIQQSRMALDEKLLLYYLYEGIRCISSHARFSVAAFHEFSGAYKFATVMREPKERFLSHFYWSTRDGAGHGKVDTSLEFFLDTNRAKAMGAIYPEYFSGFSPGSDFTSTAAIDAAIKNLGGFDIIGNLADVESLERKTQECLRLRLSIGHKNRSTTSGPSSVDELPRRLQRKLEDVCRPDIEIWNSVMRAHSEID